MFTFFAGEKAAKKLEDDILACLPMDGSDLTEDQSLTRLDNLGRGGLLKFCGIGMEAVYNGVRSLVCWISHKRAPALDLSSPSPFLLSVQARLARFLSVMSEGGAASAGATKLYGADAADKLYNEFSADMSIDPTKVTFARLQPLHIFSWLLTEE